MVSQKCTSFLGGSSKVYFVDKGEGGQKSPKMCVRLLWTPPYLQQHFETFKKRQNGLLGIF